MHKMCLRIAQLLAIEPAADGRDGFLPFHRISCSPLEVLTFIPKGPRFSDGPIFLAVGSSLNTFVTVWNAARPPLGHQALGSFLHGCIDPSRQ